MRRPRPSTRAFAANQCRCVCNDWPLVAASLLVLSLIVTQRRNAPHALWRSQDQPDLTPPVYGWLNEAFDARDLKEAKGLLEELAS